jgi:ribosomal protein L11 methyltransferase
LVVPYRIDVDAPPPDALDVLVNAGALDVDWVGGRLAAIVPDAVTPKALARALGVADLTVTSVTGRDADSVWTLAIQPVRVGPFIVALGDAEPNSAAIRLSDSAAFGTGRHPTTVLCLEALADLIEIETPSSMLDVGIGSGILAIAALKAGVPTATGIDTEPAALVAAEQNARMNGVAHRLTLAAGGPEDVSGAWPLVVANVLAAPLIEMAPALVRRVGHHGHLILSGIPSGVAPEVEHAYRHLGMGPARVTTRAGWAALELIASW